MSLRVRLTVWYTSVLAVVLALFGTVVYSILTFSLVNQIDRTLAETAQGILLASRVTTAPNMRILTVPNVDVFDASSIYVQVWDIEGHLRGFSSNLESYTEPLDPVSLQSLTTQTRIRDLVVRDNHLRVLTRPIFVDRQQVGGYLQVATGLGTVDRAKGLLLIVLVGGALGAIATAAAVGVLGAGRALEPIDRVTETALRITRADDLSRRIPLTGPATDEVGRLVMAFNETLERLENLFNAQRRFLADVSHELRTPLTAIRGNVDLLRRMGGADRTSLDAIQTEADRLTRLVGDLLLLAQAESGHLPLAKESVELDTLFLDVYQQARVLARSTNLDVLIGEEDQATVSGDRDRLKQLLLNLVGNAIQYTPEGGRVTLGLSKVNGWARVTVTDTGSGIPKDQLPHIFERFYRVDKSRVRTTFGGAGLGLSIAFWVARSHGGKIEVASEVGRGSTFSLWLPLDSGKN